LRKALLITAVVALLTAAVPASASAAFGAIAINPKTGDVGLSINKPRKSVAKKRANKDCNGKCKIVVWVRNGCAAVVATDRKYIPGVGRTKKEALRHAHRRADRPSKKVAWICSG